MQQKKRMSRITHPFSLKIIRGSVVMQYFGIEIQTNLEVRPIAREQDIDLFVQTLDFPIHLEVSDGRYSRLQFPKAKAVLIRLSQDGNSVTCHILRELDLFSSFVNFEVKQVLEKITILKKENYIQLDFK